MTNEVLSSQGQQLVKTAKIVYFLYLAALIFGVTSIIGVIMAYIYKKDSNPEWINTHFRWQIRTFWISFIGGFISALLCVIIIGYLLFIALFIWWIIRCVKGLKWLNEHKEVENVTTYFF
ncbi:DUF4870 family protein [Desulfonauticus submarinus]